MTRPNRPVGEPINAPLDQPTNHPPPSKISTSLTQPYWDAVADGELMIQRCRTCTKYQFYPGARCRRCWSDDLVWVQASGVATVWTFTIAHVAGHPHWSDQVPFVIAIVELDEGPRLTTNIVVDDVESVSVGQRVTMLSTTRTPGHPTMMFTPT